MAGSRASDDDLAEALLVDQHPLGQLGQRLHPELQTLPAGAVAKDVHDLAQQVGAVHRSLG